MFNLAKLHEELELAFVACNADLIITFANRKCKELFKEVLNMENFVGNPMADCHKPETMEKIKDLVEKYKEKKIKLDYFRMDGPDGKLTVVNLPTYDGDTLTGLVEIVLEDPMA